MRRGVASDSGMYGAVPIRRRSNFACLPFLPFFPGSCGPLCVGCATSPPESWTSSTHGSWRKFAAFPFFFFFTFCGLGAWGSPGKSATSSLPPCGLLPVRFA